MYDIQLGASCIEHYKPILDLDACRDAVFEMESHTSLLGAELPFTAYASLPPGCFRYHDGIFGFNPGIGANYTEDYEIVCQRSNHSF